jgi:hypothetical protein
MLRCLSYVLLSLPLVAVTVQAGRAADLTAPAPAPAVAAPMPPSWSFRVTPYGWLISLNGTQTVRGRSARVDASFADIVRESDTLAALMGEFEIRRGPFALFGDLAWMKVGLERGDVRTRSRAPGISASIGATLGLDIEMAILEAGATYEVARSGPLAFDVLGGIRYWHQEADLSLAVAGTVTVGDLEVAGGRAFARSGSVDWVDPLIGARVRYAVAPGHELFLRGDIGGFGVGSDFSWQAFGGYGSEFGTYNGITFSGVIGYRALSVDYEDGEGPQRYGFDMIQHGPVLGISARF